MLASPFAAATATTENIVVPELFDLDPDNAAPAIQRAIDFCYNNDNYGSVYITKQYNVSAKIILKKGVSLLGMSPCGYYEGLQYFAATDVGEGGCRIKANANFPLNTPLIECDGEAPATTNSRGQMIKNIIIDGSKVAKNGISLVGASLYESGFKLDNCTITSCNGDGLYFAGILTLIITNNNITANNGYGINFGYGVSDSSLINNYIHTNQSGGFSVADGSAYNTIIGGKIEDNYGSGVYSFRTASAVRLFLNGVTIGNNNNAGIQVENGISNNTVTATGCIIYNNGLSPSAPRYDCNVFAHESSLICQDCVFDGTPNYHAYSYGPNARVTVKNPKVITNATTYSYYSESAGVVVWFGETKDDNKPGFRAGFVCRNYITGAISTSSSSVFVFDDILEGLNATNFGGSYDAKIYEITVVGVRFYTTAASVTYRGLVVIDHDNAGNVGCAISLLPGSSDVTRIASVTSALINSNTDLEITINTGANWGSGGELRYCYVSLQEMGFNNSYT